VDRAYGASASLVSMLNTNLHHPRRRGFTWVIIAALEAYGLEGLAERRSVASKLAQNQADRHHGLLNLAIYRRHYPILAALFPVAMARLGTRG
jgi:hypothetical protein